MKAEFSVLLDAAKKAAMALVDGADGEIIVGKFKIKVRTVSRGGRVKFNFEVIPFTQIIDVSEKSK